MKVTYEDLCNPNTFTGLRKLASSVKIKGFKETYNVAKIAKRIDEEFRLFEELRQKLAKRYVDEHMVESQIKEEAEKLKEISFEIDRPLVPLDAIESCELTPNEILALAFMLDEPTPAA